MDSVEIRCSYKEIVPIDTLKPHPKNRNSHPQEQIARLAKIISFQGIRSPIKVSRRSGFMTAGHGRLEAFKALKLKHVPVDYQDYESDEQEYADLQSDNAIALWAELDLSGINTDIGDLDPDFDIDLLGIKDFTLEPADKIALCDEDEVPEHVEPKTKLGDIYKLGEHRLMCGDSTSLSDVEKLMAGELADLWIADPPFGVSYMEKNAAVNGGIVKNQIGKQIKSDTKTVEELCPFWRDSAANAYVVTTIEASNYWCACQGSDKMMMMMMMMDEAGWNIRHELIWVKDSFVFGRSDYHYRHEPIIYGWKKAGKHNWYGDRKKDSVLEISRPHKSDLHPTTKPVELFENFISNSSKANDLIFESFGGSGSTLIACEKTNRKCFMMELDPHYCDVIVARWEKYTGQTAELLNG
jgi:DNA modification methylase